MHREVSANAFSGERKNENLEVNEKVANTQFTVDQMASDGEMKKLRQVVRLHENFKR